MNTEEIDLINKIESVQDRICRNIDKYGLERFDPRDVDMIYKRIKVKNAVSLYGIRVLEMLFPIKLRKIFSISKSKFPTTYYFLADSCLESYRMNERLNMSLDVQMISDQLLSIYYEGDGKWKYKSNEKFYVIPSNKQPSMPLYGLARCNNLLLKSKNKSHSIFLISFFIDLK